MIGERIALATFSQFAESISHRSSRRQLILISITTPSTKHFLVFDYAHLHLYFKSRFTFIFEVTMLFVLLKLLLTCFLSSSLLFYVFLFQFFGKGYHNSTQETQHQNISK